MSEHVPTVGELRQAYVEASGASMAQESSYAEQVAEFERGIARIKAEALREAADAARKEAPDEPWAGATYVGFADWMAERADQIEKEGPR